MLLAGELKNVLSNISSPLAVLTSEVLDPSTLNKVAGEKQDCGGYCCSKDR